MCVCVIDTKYKIMKEFVYIYKLEFMCMYILDLLSDYIQFNLKQTLSIYEDH